MKTSRRKFGQQLTAALAMLPTAALTVSAQKKKPSKRRRRKRDGEGSPITVGGGGSVGIDFDESYYPLIAPDKYSNKNGDTIHKLYVIDKHGRITDCELPQADCTITIHSKRGSNDSAIQIFGAPLGVKFAAAEYPLEDPENPQGGTGKKIHHNGDRKITAIDISPPPPNPVVVPADGKCTIIAINEKL